VQHVVRLRDFLETRLGLLVPGVEVWMVLARQLPEGSRNLLLARRARHAQNLV